MNTNLDESLDIKATQLLLDFAKTILNQLDKKPVKFRVLIKPAKSELKKLILEAQIEQTLLIKDAFKFGKDMYEKTWLGFNYEGYFKDVLTGLEQEKRDL